jgi:hypothetical protein
MTQIRSPLREIGKLVVLKEHGIAKAMHHYLHPNKDYVNV